MIGKKNICGWCPQSKEHLELIETRFERGLCFVELRCRHCASRWTAEVAMPEREDFELAKSQPGLRTPRWHLVDIDPAEEPAVFGRDWRRLSREKALIAVEAG